MILRIDWIGHVFSNFNNLYRPGELPKFYCLGIDFASLALQCVGNLLLILMCSTFLQFPLINFLFNLGFWLCLVRYMEPQNIPGACNKTLAQVAFKTNLGSYLELRETFLALLIILGTSIAATLFIFFFEFFFL